MADTIYLEGPVYNSSDEDHWFHYPRVISADSVRESLSAIPSSTRNLTIELDSPGGNVYEGYKVYNLLKASGKNITVRVSGIAGSIATIIALSGNKVHMAPLSRFMVHNPFVSSTSGNADQLESVIDELRRIEAEMISIYASKTGKSEDEIRDIMSKETYMSPEEALEFGFIDAIAEPIKALAFIPQSNMSEIKIDEQKRGILANALSAIGKVLGISETETAPPAPPVAAPDANPVPAESERIKELEEQLAAKDKTIQELTAQANTTQQEVIAATAQVADLKNQFKALNDQLTGTFGTALNLTPVANVIDTKPVKEEVREGFRIPPNTIEKMKAKARAEGFDIKPRQPQNK